MKKKYLYISLFTFLLIVFIGLLVYFRQSSINRFLEDTEVTTKTISVNKTPGTRETEQIDVEVLRVRGEVTNLPSPEDENFTIEIDDSARVVVGEKQDDKVGTQKIDTVDGQARKAFSSTTAGELIEDAKIGDIYTFEFLLSYPESYLNSEERCVNPNFEEACKRIIELKRESIEKNKKYSDDVGSVVNLVFYYPELVIYE